MRIKDNPELNELEEAQRLDFVLATFEDCFYDSYHTKLKGGVDEPFYQAPTEHKEGVIYFRSNYLRSALHETAHWCLAGLERLKLNDWGYWYEPDGRDLKQQKEFFRVEKKPQAIEMEFCKSLCIPFDVSVDNIDGPEGPSKEFLESVVEQNKYYSKGGFPKRAADFIERLKVF